MFSLYFHISAREYIYCYYKWKVNSIYYSFFKQKEYINSIWGHILISSLSLIFSSHFLGEENAACVSLSFLLLFAIPGEPLSKGHDWPRVISPALHPGLHCLFCCGVRNSDGFLCFMTPSNTFNPLRFVFPYAWPQ